MYLHGIGTNGLAMGNAFVAQNTSDDITYRKGHFEHELQKALQALNLTKNRLQTLSATSDIFAAHYEIADDAMLWETIERYIRNDAMSAPDAIDATSEELQAVFKELDDEYLQARADDIKDVCMQIKKGILTTSHHPFEHLNQGDILVAEELLPSDTSFLDFNNLSGIITAKGSQTSHVCIIASNKGVPSIVGVGDCLLHIKTGDLILLDANKGEIYVNPDKATQQSFEHQIALHDYNSSMARMRASEKAVTHASKQIPVFANAGDLDDIQTALAAGADGIGLLRSEFLFMNKPSLPDEEIQYHTYLKAATLCAGKTLTIRTLDIGGDKCPHYIHLDKEGNPFLGLRGIRFSLAHTDIFKTQLRAILRASVLGNIRIMLPFLSDIRELEATLDIIQTCKQELNDKHIAFNPDIKVGVMIETPAAVLSASSFAEKAAFFSIGTNDLTQYIMAADRSNALVNTYYETSHPAVIHAIRLTTEAAHEHSIQVSVCGEASSDLSMIPSLIEAGVDILSTNATTIAQVKDCIRQI